MYLGQQLLRRVVAPRHIGKFELQHYEDRGLFFIQKKRELPSVGEVLVVQVLVDETDGCIVDARFRAFAPALCVALLDILLTSILRKNFIQVMQSSVNIFAPYISKQHKKDLSPHVTKWHRLFLSILQEMKEECQHIEIVTPPKETPEVLAAFVDDVVEYPDFLLLSDKKKAEIIEETLAKEVLPYIALDGGGLELLSVAGTTVHVRYQGECVTCISSLGTTLQAVAHILQRRIHPSLQVQPDLQSLHPSLLQGEAYGEQETSFN